MTAPYTPDTIATIRQMVHHRPTREIARFLGWDVSLLSSVARRHGISLTAEKVDSAILNQGNGSASVGDLRSPQATTYPDGLDWNPHTREVSRYRIVAALPGAQADFFALLYRSYRADPECYVLAPELKIVSAYYQLAGAARLLRPRLEPMRVLVEGRKAANGGYRLRLKP